MKHAAVLYTCIGLMGAAAVTGFVDYTHASKAGLLNDLYTEETASTGSTFIKTKEINVDDYSRGPIEDVAMQDQQDELALNAQPKKPKKVKKFIPPSPPPKPGKPGAPPAPGKLDEKDIPPPPPPKVEVPEVINEVPATPETPATAETSVTPATPPTPEVVEVKEVSYKIFSRAPLPRKTVAKRKKGQ